MSSGYVFRCILPYNRDVSIEIDQGYRLLASDTLPSHDIDAFAITVVNENNISRLMNLEELSRAFNFEYSHRLCFFQESDLRNMFVDWGLENSTYSAYEKNDDVKENGIAENSPVVALNDGHSDDKNDKNEDNGYPQYYSHKDLGLSIVNCKVHPSLEIRFVSSDCGNGLFANDVIEAHSYIGEYTGLVKPSQLSSSVANTDGMNDIVTPSAYALNYPSGDSHEVDALEIGNIMRFINHSQKEANCFFQPVWIDKCIHIIVKSKDRAIPKGTQLTINYGKSYWIGQKVSAVTL